MYVLIDVTCYHVRHNYLKLEPEIEILEELISWGVLSGEGSEQNKLLKKGK